MQTLTGSTPRTFMQGQDASQPKGRFRALQLWTKTGRAGLSAAHSEQKKERSVTRGDQATTLQTDRWIERTQQMNKGRQPANRCNSAPRDQQQQQTENSSLPFVSSAKANLAATALIAQG